MRQYDIRWANLPRPVGRRPVLLLTRTTAFGYLNKVIVAEVTTLVRGISQEVMLGPAEGVAARSVANLDNVHVIPKKTLGDLIGRLSPAREYEVKRALGFALDWPELKVLSRG